MQLSFRKPSLIDLFFLYYSFIGLIEQTIIRNITYFFNSVLCILLMAIGTVLGGLPFIIYQLFYYKQKKLLIKEHRNRGLKLSPKKLFEVIHQTREHDHKKITALVIIGISFAFIIILYTETLLEILLSEVTSFNLLFNEFLMLLVRVLFSKLILKTELYIHHYISIAIIIIGYSLFYYNSIDFSVFFNVVPYYLVFSSIWSFAFSYGKIIMERKYIQPMQFGLCFGVSMLLQLWLIYLIVYFIPTRNDLVQPILSLPSDFLLLFND